jgi:uncharacterized zinc-type alcohol dehydrogenase-like protein
LQVRVVGDEQLCDEGMTGTYNSYEEGQRFLQAILQVLPLMKNILYISDKLELSGVALYYVGITTYSPLRRLNVGKGHKVVF